MKVSVILPTVAILLMHFIEEGLGLKCYVCNSYLREKCAGDVTQYQDEFLVECDGNATACRKIQQEVYYSDDYNTRTIRQCSYEDDVSNTCVRRTGTYRYKVFYCHCDDAGCNSAVSTTMSVTLLSLALGLAHVVGKHL